jgi:hypothetical protein
MSVPGATPSAASLEARLDSLEATLARLCVPIAAGWHRKAAEAETEPERADCLAHAELVEAFAREHGEG